MTMTILSKQQRSALATWHKNLEWEYQQLHAALGLVGEAGEFIELIKKDWFKPNRGVLRHEYLDELADVFYYVCILAALEDCTLEELAAIWEDKLKDGHGWQPDYMRELEDGKIPTDSCQDMEG